MAAGDNQYWMKFALQEAEKALEEDEIPVGAVLVKDGNLIISNHNRTRQNNNPTAHAEKLVIEEIIRKREKFLYDYTLFVTLEPCSMCAGMLILSKLGSLVYGARDLKSGAVGSLYNIPSDKQLNHNIEVVSGVLSQECGELLKRFFQSKR
jgi:tRNA(adenine34) deaminase